MELLLLLVFRLLLEGGDEGDVVIDTQSEVQLEKESCNVAKGVGSAPSACS
jgi:hypothetical protein